MGNVGKPLIGILVATVLVFALWVIALRPGASTTGGGSGGGSSGAGSSDSLGAYSTDINKAKQAVQISNASNAQSGQVVTPGGQSTPATAAPSTSAPTPTTTAGSPASSTTSGAAPSAGATAQSKHAASRSANVSAVTARAAAGNLKAAERALREHKALAVLFYNPGGSDDQAVRQELAAVPSHAGQVVKLAVPLSQISGYTAITEQVPVNISPTLVLVGRNGQAGEIVGFADQFEIAQRVADALAATAAAAK